MYDVFINFRGKDTREKFVSHLHYALSKAGVNTFLDDSSLQRGNMLKAELKRAIEWSRIYLVVFSKNYTESTWCLDELEQIMEREKLSHRKIDIVPIFYDIDPSVVRHQSDNFGKALKATVKKRYSGKEAELVLFRWSLALTKASNFSGWNAKDYRGYVTKILNGCGLHADIGIAVLIERSLIKVENNNKLGMHPLLQDMGREVICESSRHEPWKRSRLWSQEDVLDVLTNNTGTEAVQGLALKLNFTSRDCFEASAFKEMKGLRLLQLDHAQLTGDYGYLSKQLRWVCWRGFPFKYIPNNFDLKGVIAMDLRHSTLRLLWKKTQVLQSLKILNLSHSIHLTETPDFSGLPSLEKLILKDCPSLCKVHQSIGDLQNILFINLKDCTSLCNLPKEIYKLKSLKTLILAGCSNIDKLEEDIVQMESLITLIAENTAVRQVPFSIVSLKSIGYITLCGYEGLSRNVFPSIIQSWMSPTMNPLSGINLFSGTSSSLVSMDIQNSVLGDLAPMLSKLSNLRSVLVHCDTEFQLSKQLGTILDDMNNVNLSEVENTSHTSQIVHHSLESFLIGIGSYKEVFNTLSKSISEGLTTSESFDVFLPGDKDPFWLAHTGEGHSVYFTVPDDFRMKGMTLCIVYLSTPENTAIECLVSVLMVNYTKCTIQIFKRDTVISFNDVDWQGMISHLGCGDKVEIFVIFRHGLVVKKTAVYLMYDKSIDIKMEPSPEQMKEPEQEPKKEAEQEPKREAEKGPKKNYFVRCICKIVMCKMQDE
ncbi:unnamed protein product [Sphenostylis stenocarpa]|uniref:TIR domain-containing protein n=1 Tax=Sphenostylis stenocarpa TaxID=92480 RepID=A0AA86SAH3_9FABA|nr:unnamed protein product [Sphenostylis stenocarpa]